MSTAYSQASILFNYLLYFRSVFPPPDVSHKLGLGLRPTSHLQKCSNFRDDLLKNAKNNSYLFQILIRINHPKTNSTQLQISVGLTEPQTKQVGLAPHRLCTNISWCGNRTTHRSLWPLIGSAYGCNSTINPAFLSSGEDRAFYKLTPQGVQQKPG